MKHVLNDCSKRRPSALQRSAGAFLVLIMTMGWLIPAHSQALRSTPVTAVVPPPSEQVLDQVQTTMPVYGNSVIPGGVQGSSELTAVLARDNITRAHFADFDTANAYVVHAPSARRVHVSYRMGNAIYWTKNTVQIAKGEALLTDGKTFVRTRCGNRIADAAQSTVSNMEPAPAILDTVLAQPPEAVSLTGNASAPAARRQAMRLQTSGNLSSDPGSLAAPANAFLGSQGQSSAPLSGAQGRPVPAGPTASPALAEPVQGELVQVKALAPALAAAIDNELLAVLVTLSPTALTPSAPSMPIREIRAVPLPESGPGTIAPSGKDRNAAPTVAQALPSALSDLDALPIPSGVENVTELPEPGSFALLMLGLMLFTVMRPRQQRKN